MVKKKEVAVKKSVNKKPAPAAKKASAEKAVAKKDPAKKAVIQKAPSDKKAVVKKTPAKKEVAKKEPVKKELIKKGAVEASKIPPKKVRLPKISIPNEETTEHPELDAMTPQQGDIPVSVMLREERNEKIKELIALASEHGFLTHEDIEEALPEDLV
ncbi:MAG: RNA polymerase sigma factor region1.1 domain-containing protein, partial [Kiritimatiellales bacterium]